MSSRFGKEKPAKPAPVVAPRRRFCAACKREITGDIRFAFNSSYHPEHAPDGARKPPKTQATPSAPASKPGSGSASRPTVTAGSIERNPGESDEDFKKRRRRERRAARKARQG